MGELLALLAVVGAFALVALVPWIALVELGAALAALGMTVGLPAGLLYHVRLRGELLRAGELPRRWWVSPLRLHERLPASALRRVLPSCYVGAGGFAIVALGCALAFLGVVGSFGLGPAPL